MSILQRVDRHAYTASYAYRRSFYSSSCRHDYSEAPVVCRLFISYDRRTSSITGSTCPSLDLDRFSDASYHRGSVSTELRVR